MHRPVYVITELYYPEESATGYLLTRIAEGLASSGEVRVLTGQPSYLGRGTRAAREEIHAGVSIHRSWGTMFDKNFLLARLVNALTIAMSIFIRALRELRPGTITMVVTNPPFLPLVAAIAARLRRARLVLLLHDIYPDVLVASGMARKRDPVVRILAALNKLLYKKATRVVVLGRDMERLIGSRSAGPSGKIRYIPNWGDTDTVQVEKMGNNELRSAWGLQNAFVVLYAGNIGRTHGLETLIGAAEKLRDSPEIQFLIIGSGAKKDWMEQEKQTRRLTNVHFQPNQPRSRQTAFLNACDIGIISYASGMSGVSVPSRMYNLFASGKPVIAVADRDSELALVVQEEQIGWVVPPSSPEALVAALREAQASAPDLLRDLGMRARKMVESKYTLERTVRGYATLVQELRDAESR